jgi:hypothetical protein
MAKLFSTLLLLLLTLIVFHTWLSPGLLSTYDFPYYSQLMMKTDAHLQLYAWDWHPNLDGFSLFFSPYSWVFPFIYIPQVIFGKLLGLDWSAIQKITYLYPYLILSIISPILLAKHFLPKNKFYLISVLIFSFNTYALLLAGGEIFLALAYALAPIIFILFIKLIEKPNLQLSLLFGLLTSLQIMFDPRISYVTLFVVALYTLFTKTSSLVIPAHSPLEGWLAKPDGVDNSPVIPAKAGIQLHQRIKTKSINFLKPAIYILIIPAAITILLHAFWIFPTIMYGKNPISTLGTAYSTTEAVKYLSFAKLENTISLLHPNWPDNIFGKVGFMKPEFLILPIIAFISLLFIKKSKTPHKKTIIFFSLLGLIGAFLAKGTNDPFGGIYLWLFNHVPGFSMFRDPTKWYLLIALSYSILIPFSLHCIYEWLSTKRFHLQNIFILITIIYLLFLIRPAIFNQLGGMFKTTTIPDDYVKLEKFLYDQKNYFRTLAMPSKQRYEYYSTSHPLTSAQILFNTYDDKKLLQKLTEKGTEKTLREAGFKYIIIPNDSEKEIFLNLRKYDDKKYKNLINNLEKIPWLKQKYSFGKIKIFEITNPKDHFWSPSKNIKISYQFINPTKYSVKIKNAKRGDRIIFTENYDTKWTAKITKEQNISLSSNAYNLAPQIKMNSFLLPENGNYTLEVYYQPQKWVELGTKISLITFLITIIILSLRAKRSNLSK